MTKTSRARLSGVVAVLVVLGAFFGSYQSWKKTQTDAAKEVEAIRMERELAVAEAKLNAEHFARVEAELKAKLSRDSTVMTMRDSADHGYLELDYLGKVLIWNAALERWTGYTQSEMIGHTLERVMSPEDYEPHSTNYVQWIQVEDTKISTLRLECKLINKNGKRVSVIVTARKVPAEIPGEQPRALGMIDRPRQVLDLSKHEQDEVPHAAPGK